MSKVGGRLISGDFYCLKCLHNEEMLDETVPLFYEDNIYPYRQTCHCCGCEVVVGREGWPELFSKRAKETKQPATARQILDTISGQRFYEWYHGRFETYITDEFEDSDPRCPTEEQILADIECLFRRIFE